MMYSPALVYVNAISLFVLAMKTVSAETEEHKYCFRNTSEIPQRKTFHYNNYTLPIVIETSHRASHILVSHILKIMLEEYLGFENVQLQEKPAFQHLPGVLSRLSECPYGCTHYQPLDYPPSMINLEVWTPPGYSLDPWTEPGYISDDGPLGPQGRYGWYIPTKTVQESWQNDRYVLEHWRSLQIPDVQSKFTYQDVFESKVNIVNENSSFYDCQNEYCVKPGNKCSDNPQDCLTLLSDFPDFEAPDNHASELGLDMSVAWLGTNLTNVIRRRTISGTPSLFINWTPNTLTLSGNYTRVALPYCIGDEHPTSACDFEIHNFRKATWPKIQTHLPEVYHVISHMSFTQEQYEELIKIFITENENFETAKPSSYASAACKWISKYREVCNVWLPPEMSSKKKLYLGAMFPLTGPYLRQPGVIPAAILAQSVINKSQRYLPDYDLILLLKDTKCQTDIAMKNFMDLLVSDTKVISGVIGVGCSTVAESIAGVSKHFNRIVVSYSAEVSLRLSDRKAYPYFFRAVPPITQNAAVYEELFTKFKWCKVALLAEDAEEFPDFNTHLQAYLTLKNFKVPVHRTIPRTRQEHYIKYYLSEIKKSGTKIIVVTSFEICARILICEAIHKKMAPSDGYVWFLPHWFTESWWNVEYFNAYNQESVTTCTSHDMLRSLRGHFILSSAVFGNPDTEIVENMTVNEWQDAYLRSLSSLGLERYRSPYASYTYDAVWTFAMGLHNLLTENPSAYYSLTTINTTSRLMGHMNKTSFQGASGPVKFDGSDRTGIIDVYQFRDNATEMALVGYYDPNSNKSAGLTMYMKTIEWKGGSVLKDCIEADRKCGIEFFRKLLGISCDLAIIIVNVSVIVAIAIFLLVLILAVKRRYEHKVKDTKDRMKELGLLQDSAILALDNWEIPRDLVVLNRKLGEGAFGMVYGGEALVSDDNWTAVAVKTLKSGSNAEEKLDFLSEAEMMKRFKHNNIIRFVGICTREEPILAIMEFMLYGDLKTFLLDRKYLVGQFYSEAEDVSTNMLTKYALDIAKGVQYLSENKYVHRDLACRNCLVSAEKVVKLADFGMTRPVFDCDYYRFNRKGMLPVRWMAPESLTNGIFVPASDVWAYGIILYEIMTLGNLPYQGMTNKDVLKHVTEGNTLALPSACSPEMQEMLYSCWCFDKNERRSISEVVETLTERPLLVQPLTKVPQRIDHINTELSVDQDVSTHKISKSKSSHPFMKHNVKDILLPTKRTAKRKRSSLPSVDSSCTIELSTLLPERTFKDGSVYKKPNHFSLKSLQSFQDHEIVKSDCVNIKQEVQRSKSSFNIVGC